MDKELADRKTSISNLAVLTGRALIPADVRSAGGMATLNWILSAEEPETFVQAIATPDLYFLMKDIGLSDSHVLLELATVEQISGVLDIDIWSKHEVKLDRWRGHGTRAASAFDDEGRQGSYKRPRPRHGPRHPEARSKSGRRLLVHDPRRASDGR